MVPDIDYSSVCGFCSLSILFSVINVGGLSVTGKDLIDIGERNAFLPGRVRKQLCTTFLVFFCVILIFGYLLEIQVVDILTRLVASNFKNQALGRGDTTTVFLDSSLQCLLSRNYPRIKKSKSKEAYVFSKAMVDLVSKSYSKNTHVARFYIPFNVDRKHWVGLCVDIQSSKIFVLDCNTGVIMDEALVKELFPISHMFPYLLKHIGNVEQPNGNEMVVERMKGLLQNTNPADSALTACLLIQTHALFGFDVCRSLTPTVIPAEARKAAIMLYEFHKKL